MINLEFNNDLPEVISGSVISSNKKRDFSEIVTTDGEKLKVEGYHHFGTFIKVRAEQVIEDEISEGSKVLYWDK